MHTEDLYNIYLQHPSVVTDTRRLKKGDIFIALKGPNFNGNHFLKDALQAGAAFVIMDEGDTLHDGRIIKVNNALQSLQDLAKHHREELKKRHNGEGIPFLAITGSNGKTTTKELVHQVLATTYKTYATEGNLNNQIGVPLTLLRIQNDAEIAVIEMGANHTLEIESYCRYAMPTHGMITNIGKAHLEGFGSFEMIRKGKGELFDYLKANNGIAIVNTDDNNIVEISRSLKNTFTYGSGKAEVTGIATIQNSFLQVEMTNGFSFPFVSTQLIGSYNLSNVLAAISVGKIFNVPENKIKSAIEFYSPENNRSQLVKKGSNTIILDAYNANPSSMKAAIENFESMPGSNKILMLGAMAELGGESRLEHQKIINLVDSFQWAHVALVGKSFKKSNPSYKYFDTSSQLKDWFARQQIENSMILIKGSRSMQMETVLD
ncbi:MAG: UDP-N-acetylmuramoyl-tripeptide--D-alanyl-D-alanine ligase [Ginsengibacter sp.]